MVADCTRMQSRLLAFEAQRHATVPPRPPTSVSSSPIRPDDVRLFRSPPRRARSAQSPARRMMSSLGESAFAFDLKGRERDTRRRPHTAGDASDLKEDVIRYRSYMLRRAKARSPTRDRHSSSSSPSNLPSPQRHKPRMLELLEELGVMPDEYPQYFGDAGASTLTHGTSVTFRGNPIRAMRDRRRRPATAAVHGRSEPVALPTSSSSVLDILDRARAIDSMPREKMIAELERWRGEESEESEASEEVILEGDTEADRDARDSAPHTRTSSSSRSSGSSSSVGCSSSSCSNGRGASRRRRGSDEPCLRVSVVEEVDQDRKIHSVVAEEKSRDSFATTKESDSKGSMCAAYADAKLVEMLRKRPIDVPELKTRKAFRNFFAGASRDRILRLLREAFGSDAKGERRVQKRMALIGSSLVSSVGTARPVSSSS